MSELKSVNIASWGLVILAVFLLIIGLEEVLWMDGMEEYQYVPGITTLILGIVMSLIALFAFWNGNRKYGVIFIALGIVFSFIALVIGIDVKLPDLSQIFVGGEPLNIPMQAYLGGRGLMFGIAVALFAFVIAVWAYLQEGLSKIVTVMLAAIGVFALLEGISNALIDVDLVPVLGDLEIPIYSFEDGFLPLRVAAGFVAVVAAVLAFYEGYVNPVILGKNSVEDEDKSLGTFDVTAIGFAITAFMLLLIGLSGISMIEGLEKYVFIPGMSIIFLGTVLFVIALFAYWNGNKQTGVIFTWIAVFSIVMGMLLGFNIALLDQYVVADEGWSLIIGFANKTLIVSIVLGIFTFFIAGWTYFQKNVNKLLPVFFVVLGIMAILIGISGMYLNGEGSQLPAYVDCDDEFIIFRLIVGVLALIAMGLALYGGFVKPELMGKFKDTPGDGLKTYDTSVIGYLLMAFTLVLIGIAGITQLEALSDFEINPKSFATMGIVLTLVAIPLSYWHGKSFPTVLFFILNIFFVLFTITYRADQYGVVYGIVVALFLAAVAFWAYKQKECPVLFTVIFGLLALSMLVLAIANIVFADEGYGDTYYTVIAVTGAIQLIAGLVFTYVAIAKSGTVELSTA